VKGWGPLAVGIALLCLLHADLWWWNDLRLVAGVPASLLYHLAYCAVAAVAMGALVRRRWPRG